jgi:DNA-binding transcriptional regulator YhcF (GntR family)
MTFTLAVKTRRMLFTGQAVPYDVGNLTPAPAGDSVPGDITDPTAVSRQVAASLRAAILSGEYAPGSELPSQKDLADRYGYSEATMNRALAELARDGLVRMGSGRRTIVLEHFCYAVTVTVPHAGGQKVRERVLTAVSDRLADLEAGGVLSDTSLSCAHNVMQVRMTVNAADPGRAAMLGLSAVVQASGQGWDFPHGTVTAQPAGQEH